MCQIPAAVLQLAEGPHSPCEATACLSLEHCQGQEDGVDPFWTLGTLATGPA